MGSNIKLKSGEAKTITFTITDEDSGSVVDCSEASIDFAVKQDKDDETNVIEKTDSDFDKTNASVGIVALNLSAEDTTISSGNYVGELKITFSETNIDKSQDILFIISESVS